MARAIAAQLLFAVSLIASAVSAQTRPATSQPAQQVGLKFERMTVEVEPAIPAGLPVVFRAIIPNEGGQGKLLLTAPGKYLQGSYFSVRISRAGVEPKTIVTENGAASQGRLTEYTVGSSMEVPLSIPPRDAGDYDAQLIYVGSRWGAVTGRPLTKFRLHVVEDADVHKRWIQQRVDEVRLCESFAAYVCITHNVEEVIDVMVGDLTDDYPARAGFAAGSLQYYNRRPLSAKTLDAIEKALQKHVDAKPITPSWEHAIPAIIRLARSDPQDRFLPAILKYSESENFYVRDEAIGALQSFHQLAATDQLVKLVDLKGVTDRFIIAHAMASRGDERELPALAEFASESNTSRSGGRPEFDLLVMFPDVKVAADAVDAGLKSTNPDIRSSAERAMHPQIMGFIDPIGREPVPKSIQDLSVQAAAKTILDASDFVVIDQATAADASVPAIAIRMIANRPGERAAAYHFIRKGTIQAKMYGLCILFFCEPPIMRKMADDLVAQGGEVSVVDNGQQSTQPVEQVIKRIVSGGYPRRLTRLYTPSNPASNPATRPVSK